MTDRISRRRMMSIALAAGGAVSSLWLTGKAWAAGTPPAANVDEKDSLAVALGYVADARRVDAKANPTYQSGSICSSCSWYQGKPADAAGPCTFFPGKLVDAHGWCKMWNKKQ